MKLLDNILLSLAVVFFIIGLDQLFKGFTSYWIFMLSVMFLMILNYRKLLKHKASQPKAIPKETHSPKPSAKKPISSKPKTKKK